MIQLLSDHPWIIVVVLLWSLPWKGVALWRSARRGHMGWFFALFIVNTLAILDILYIFAFSGKEEGDDQQKPNLQSQIQPQPVVNPNNKPTIV